MQMKMRNHRFQRNMMVALVIFYQSYHSIQFLIHHLEKKKKWLAILAKKIFCYVL